MSTTSPTDQEYAALLRVAKKVNAKIEYCDTDGEHTFCSVKAVYGDHFAVFAPVSADAPFRPPHEVCWQSGFVSYADLSWLKVVL